jgi:hypothetical protein
VLGWQSSETNHGLANEGGAYAVLRGGSFTAHGGTNARGVSNSGDGATLEAYDITALGKGADEGSYGLYNLSGDVTLRGGSFTGLEFVHARGIYNTGVDSALDAERISAEGSGGESSNNGLRHINGNTVVSQSVLRGATNTVYRSAGTVTVSNSRLIGGVVSGSVTCVAVTRATTFYESTCP